MVTDTVVAPRAAVPLMTRLRPVPVEPAAGEVIWTAGRSGLAAWTPTAGPNANARSRTDETHSARRVIVRRIRTPNSAGPVTRRRLPSTPPVLGILAGTIAVATTPGRFRCLWATPAPGWTRRSRAHLGRVTGRGLRARGLDTLPHRRYISA